MRNKLFVLLAFILMLTGCAASDGEEPEATMAVSTPEPTQRITELHVAMPVQVETFHPLLCTQRDMRSLLALVFEPLVELDDEGLPTGCLAASFQQDGAVWTVKLRPQVTWQGLDRPLSSDDIIYSLDLIQSIGAQGPYGYVLDHWTQWQKMDEQTITLRAAYPSYGSILSLDFPILPANAGYSAEQAPALAIGTGPYTMGPYQSGSELNLTRNDKWWKQLPEIQTITAHPYADTQTAATSLMLHQLDVVQSDDLVTEQYSYAGDANAYQYVTPYFEFLAFRCEEGLFSDARLRQAVAYCLDRKALGNTVYMTHTTLADAPLIPTIGLYDHQARLSQDVSLSQALLSQMEWTQTNPLRLLACENKAEPVREEAAELIVKQLEAVGIKAQVVMKPWEDYKKAIEDGEFDMVLAGWYLTDCPDLSRFFAQTGEDNFMGYASPAMDACLDSIANAADRTSFSQAITTFKDQLFLDMPIVSLYFRNHTLLTSAYVKGVSRIEEDQAFAGIAQWLISADFS